MEPGPSKPRRSRPGPSEPGPSGPRRSASSEAGSEEREPPPPMDPKVLAGPKFVLPKKMCEYIVNPGYRSEENYREALTSGYSHDDILILSLRINVAFTEHGEPDKFYDKLLTVAASVRIGQLTEELYELLLIDRNYLKIGLYAGRKRPVLQKPETVLRDIAYKENADGAEKFVLELKFMPSDPLLAAMREAEEREERNRPKKRPERPERPERREPERREPERREPEPEKQREPEPDGNKDKNPDPIEKPRENCDNLDHHEQNPHRIEEEEEMPSLSVEAPTEEAVHGATPSPKPGALIGMQFVRKRQYGDSMTPFKFEGNASRENKITIISTTTGRAKEELEQKSPEEIDQMFKEIASKEIVRSQFVQNMNHIKFQISHWEEKLRVGERNAMPEQQQMQLKAKIKLLHNHLRVFTTRLPTVPGSAATAPPPPPPSAAPKKFPVAVVPNSGGLRLGQRPLIMGGAPVDQAVLSRLVPVAFSSSSAGQAAPQAAPAAPKLDPCNFRPLRGQQQANRFVSVAAENCPFKFVQWNHTAGRRRDDERKNVSNTMRAIHEFIALCRHRDSDPSRFLDAYYQADTQPTSGQMLSVEDYNLHSTRRRCDNGLVKIPTLSTDQQFALFLLNVHPNDADEQWAKLYAILGWPVPADGVFPRKSPATRRAPLEHAIVTSTPLLKTSSSSSSSSTTTEVPEDPHSTDLEPRATAVN